MRPPLAPVALTASMNPGNLGQKLSNLKRRLGWVIAQNSKSNGEWSEQSEESALRQCSGNIWNQSVVPKIRSMRSSVGFS
jgi:hypothetical protein